MFPLEGARPVDSFPPSYLHKILYSVLLMSAYRPKDLYCAELQKYSSITTHISHVNRAPEYQCITEKNAMDMVEKLLVVPAMPNYI